MLSILDVVTGLDPDAIGIVTRHPRVVRSHAFGARPDATFLCFYQFILFPQHMRRHQSINDGFRQEGIPADANKQSLTRPHQLLRKAWMAGSQ